MVKKHKKNIDEDIFADLVIDSIYNNKDLDKKCLIQELSRLKQSSKEAVESIGEFSTFKKYMHIERGVQTQLEELILLANESDKAQLILVCGSVGDGKSHIISYLNDKNSDIMKNFTLHNDATESLDPSKTAMDTLNEVLDSFSDERLEKSNQKLILAINLGTLNNFIDSKYNNRFKLLRKYVEHKKILETGIVDNKFEDNSSFQFVNLSDYHIFTLKEGKAYSEYILSLINKITDQTQLNIFYNTYMYFCSRCDNCECCPIKANYELLSNSVVQEVIVDLLVQCNIKNKIIISTRSLMNFIYELIVPRVYINVNSPMYQTEIHNMNDKDYIKSLLPNMIFENNDLSFIFKAIHNLDPLCIRNKQVDNFILEFINASDITSYFRKYIDFQDIYINRINKIDVSISKQRTLIIKQLLKLFIRSYYFGDKKELFSLKDKSYDEFIEGLYHYNRGDKLRLRPIYDNVRRGIMRWNGEGDINQINIIMGNKQVKYNIREELKLKVDTSNLPQNDNDNIEKFITEFSLDYKCDNCEVLYTINIDFPLYSLLLKIINGYRPNKKDKNHFINFVEFINELEKKGSQDRKLLFKEKYKNDKKQYCLEYDDEFESYRFMEIERWK